MSLPSNKGVFEAEQDIPDPAQDGYGVAGAEEEEGFGAPIPAAKDPSVGVFVPADLEL